MTSLKETTLKTPRQFVNDNDNTAIQTTPSVLSHLLSVTQNTSLQDGCTPVNFSERGYLPWDNPDNIVSAKVERVSHAIKNNLLGLLFLIGGPANVINMAVFYKQGLKDRVNLCLFVLSLTDGLYLLVNMLLYGDQLYLQFTTKEAYGPMMTFLINIKFTGFVGLYAVSPVLSAIIAVERCYCVLRPLKYQTLMRTRTMAAMIIAVYVIVLGLFFIDAVRYRIGCLYDLESGAILKTLIIGESYGADDEFSDALDGIVFGVALPGVVMIAAISSTIITVVKLRQIVTWRAGTSSSLSPGEVALTKMLVGNSIFFIVCVSPVAVIHFLGLFLPEMNAGQRHHNFYLTSVWITVMFGVINSTFNIFVYYAMGSRYRETFWSLFSRKSKTAKI